MSIAGGGLVFAGSTLVGGGVRVPGPGAPFGLVSSLQEIAAPGTAHTWSAWSEITASTAAASQWLRLTVGGTAIPGNGQDGRVLVQVATGAAGAESPIITLSAANLTALSLVADLPLPIAAGQRVAWRLQAGRAGGTMEAQFWLGALPFTPTTPIGMGIDTATSDGVSLAQPATSDGATWGAWTEITASSAARFVALHHACSLDGIINMGARNFQVDIGVGAAGAEVSIGQIITYRTATNELIYGATPKLLPCDIPAGSRISARFTRTNADGRCALVLHGVPQ